MTDGVSAVEDATKHLSRYQRGGRPETESSPKHYNIHSESPGPISTDSPSSSSEAHDTEIVCDPVCSEHLTCPTRRNAFRLHFCCMFFLTANLS